MSGPGALTARQHRSWRRRTSATLLAPLRSGICASVYGTQESWRRASQQEGNDREKRCLKIESRIDEGAVEGGLIEEATRSIVVTQIAPADLRPHPARHLKFDAALQLVAPIVA